MVLWSFTNYIQQVESMKLVLLDKFSKCTGTLICTVLGLSTFNCCEKIVSNIVNVVFGSLCEIVKNSTFAK